MNSVTNRWFKLGSVLVFLLVLVFCIYRISYDIYVSINTGVLKVSTPDKAAIITISQADSQAARLGVGSAAAHLKPGRYFVVVQSGGQQAGKSVQVSARQTSSLSMNPSKGFTLPSASSVSFSGVSDLVDNGLSATQAAKVELSLFKYKPSVQLININNVEMFRKSTAPVSVFEMTFDVIIDSTPYTASITYSNIDDVSFQLFNLSGSRVFDSNN